ncbi:hypothetical protein ACFL6K_00370 [Candidatus Latescibacterota bacterium]
MSSSLSSEALAQDKFFDWGALSLVSFFGQTKKGTASFLSFEDIADCPQKDRFYDL